MGLALRVLEMMSWDELSLWEGKLVLDLKKKYNEVTCARTEAGWHV